MAVDDEYMVICAAMIYMLLKNAEFVFQYISSLSHIHQLSFFKYAALIPRALDGKKNPFGTSSSASTLA